MQVYEKPSPINRTGGGENTKTQTNPVKVIREKCLDCCCGSANEVKLCTAERCPLHPWRMGKNPYRKPPTDEQRQAARERFAKNVQGRPCGDSDQYESRG